MKNKSILAGIRPTGNLHLGHYLGVIKPALELQIDNIVKFGIMDLHNINPERQKYLEISSFKNQLIKLGINNIFIQSELSEIYPNFWKVFWIFSKIVTNGQLSRMTQYKDKKNSNPSLALLSYPVLMATDIAVSNCEYILIGKDQKQHLELAKDLIHKANKIHGYVGIEPKPLVIDEFSKIMSLKNPLKKMSKSDDEAGCILLNDSEEEIVRKIKKASTTQQGILNLKTIYKGCGFDDVLDFKKASDAKNKITKAIFKLIK